MSDIQKSSEGSASALPETLPVHFIKSNSFRVIHANGAWFGNDPQANLHLTFYSERTPIPQKVVFQLNDKGQLVGEEMSQREGKEGVVRELEVDVVMSLAAANAFYEILGNNLKQATQFFLNQQASETK